MLALSLILSVSLWLASAASDSLRVDYGISNRQAEPMPGQLHDFQVYEPVFVPEGTSNEYGCVYTMTLMEYDFANSYGAPFVGQ